MRAQLINTLRFVPCLFLLLGAISCQLSSNHVIETHHEIKPIEINVNIRVEKELDHFFEDLDVASETVNAPGTVVETSD